MDIIVVGINHKKAPFDIREKVAFSDSMVRESLAKLNDRDEIRECVILSTCNRSEIIASVEYTHEGIALLRDYYHQYFSIKDGVLDGYLFAYSGEKAVKHVFRMASGLESLVVGEDQILGQLRTAHEVAMECNTTGNIINKLVREAITTAKKVKRETKISENSLSISTIAIKFLEERFKDLTSLKILVIGVGKMNRIAIENLLSKGATNIYVTNRTKGHAMDLSKRYDQIEVIDFNDRYDYVPKVDVVISCTSAPHYILREEEFKALDLNRDLTIIDIALPRDVEESIGDIGGVEVIKLDELKEVSERNMGKRREAACQAEEIIIEDCIKFDNWYNCLEVFPVIRELEVYYKDIIEKELATFLPKLKSVDDKDKENITLFVNSLGKKLFKSPLMELKRAGEDKQGSLYGKITKEIFGLMDNSCLNQRDRRN